MESRCTARVNGFETLRQYGSQWSFLLVSPLLMFSVPGNTVMQGYLIRYCAGAGNLTYTIQYKKANYVKLQSRHP